MRCEKCGLENEKNYKFCGNCGITLVEDDKNMVSKSIDYGYGQAETASISKMAVIFYVISILGVFGAIIAAIKFWPEPAPDGYEWKMQAYYGAFGALLFGAFQALFFAACGHVINFLKKIEFNTKK